MLQMSGRYHFQGQHENETVLRVVHRHWFNILTHLFLIFVFSLLLIGSVLLLPLLFPEALDANSWRFFVFVENTFFVFIWIYSFLVWIDYYFDVWIITSERIVNIEQKGLFVRHVSELRFSRVQDVTCTVEGIIPTVLNFGDVYVQTAAEEERFVFRQVGDPYGIKDVVMRLSQSSANADLSQAVRTIEEQN